MKYYNFKLGDKVLYRKILCTIIGARKNNASEANSKFIISYSTGWKIDKNKKYDSHTLKSNYYNYSQGWYVNPSQLKLIKSKSSLYSIY